MRLLDIAQVCTTWKTHISLHARSASETRKGRWRYFHLACAYASLPLPFRGERDVGFLFEYAYYAIPGAVFYEPCGDEILHAATGVKRIDEEGREEGMWFSLPFPFLSA